MVSFVWLSAAAAVGYVAAVHTWPTVRQWLTGIEGEIDLLRSRLRELEKRLRG